MPYQRLRVNMIVVCVQALQADSTVRQRLVLHPLGTALHHSCPSYPDRHKAQSYS